MDASPAAPLAAEFAEASAEQQGERLSGAEAAPTVVTTPPAAMPALAAVKDQAAKDKEPALKEKEAPTPTPRVRSARGTGPKEAVGGAKSRIPTVRSSRDKENSRNNV